MQMLFKAWRLELMPPIDTSIESIRGAVRGRHHSGSCKTARKANTAWMPIKSPAMNSESRGSNRDEEEDEEEEDEEEEEEEEEDEEWCDCVTVCPDQ